MSNLSEMASRWFIDDDDINKWWGRKSTLWDNEVRDKTKRAEIKHVAQKLEMQLI